MAPVLCLEAYVSSEKVMDSKGIETSEFDHISTRKMDEMI